MSILSSRLDYPGFEPSSFKSVVLSTTFYLSECETEGFNPTRK